MIGANTRKIQIGPEATAGAADDATAIYLGPGSLKDLREIQRIKTGLGTIAPSSLSYTKKYGAEFTWDPFPASFEQMCYFGEAGIKAVGTGVADGGGGSGLVYAYPMPVNATANAIKTYTLEGGDGVQEEEMEYGFVKEFTLEGSGGDMLNVSAKWGGRQVATGTYTAGLTPTAVEYIYFNKGKLWIDDTGTAIGTDQQENTFVSCKLTVVTGFREIHTGDGSLYYASVGFADPSVTLDLTFFHDADSVDAKAKWRAETAALIRMEWLGSAFETGGTYDYKTLRCDLAGKWDTFEVLGEREGFQVCTGKFIAGVDTVAALYFAMTVANNLAAMP